MPPTWPTQVAHLLKLHTIYLEVRMWHFQHVQNTLFIIQKEEV